MPLSQTPNHVFLEGDQALVVDRKGRRYLLTLNSSDTFHTHLGNIAHSELIGKNEGIRVKTSNGHSLLAVKPTMVELTREMPRIATVVYPKDLGAIIAFGDIFPGARILEAGTGSGAVTIALTRTVGCEGRVISYDVRTDMIERAKSNVEAALSQHHWLTIKQGDVYNGFEEGNLDRIILDLPEPWRVVHHASQALVPGGVFLGFLPTVLQVRDFVHSLREEGTFDLIETFEVLLRPWSIGDRSIRPDQRMVSHTGFITTARRCSPRTEQSP